MANVVYNSYLSDALIYNHTLRASLSPGNGEIHSHDVYEMLFVKGGDVSYICGGKTYKLRKHSLVLSRPAELHSIYVDSLCDYNRYDILFDEKHLPESLRDKIRSGIDVVSFEGNPRVIDLFSKMDFYAENMEGEELGILLFSLVQEVCFNLTMSNTRIVGSTANTVVNRALHYIEDNLTTLESINELANELYVTKSHLHHLFKEHLSVSPKQYLLSKRLTLAQKAIYSGMRATQAAVEFGFKDYSSFYRDFKKYFGYSPSDVGKVKIPRQIKS